MGLSTVIVSIFKKFWQFRKKYENLTFSIWVFDSLSSPLWIFFYVIPNLKPLHSKPVSHPKLCPTPLADCNSFFFLITPRCASPWARIQRENLRNHDGLRIGEHQWKRDNFPNSECLSLGRHQSQLRRESVDWNTCRVTLIFQRDACNTIIPRDVDNSFDALHAPSPLQSWTNAIRISKPYTLFSQISERTTLALSRHSPSPETLFCFRIFRTTFIWKLD